MSRTLVKICGITCPDDAVAAVDAGADAIGLVFWPGSKRFINMEKAKEIRKHVPSGIVVVGVFVDPGAEMLAEISTNVDLNAVQLSGELASLDWRAVPPSLRVVRSIAVNGNKEASANMRMTNVVDYLLDNGAGGSFGGSGMPFDWQRAREYREWGRIWIAGGLTPQNVGDAIRLVHPYAVDVSTGVETAPGKKSPQLIRNFIDAVRKTDDEMTREKDRAA